MLFQWLCIFFRKSPAGSRFLKSLKFTISWCAEPKPEAWFHFWSQISWNLMCAERKPEITFSHFHCSRIGLLQNQGIGTPTHYAAHFFFLAAVRVPVHNLGFCNTSPVGIVFFGGENLKSVNAVRTFHLGHQNCHHHFCLFNFEWETLHYFDSFFALEIFKIATRQTHVRATFFLQFQDFVTIRIAILAQGFSSDGKIGIPTLGAEHKKKFVLRP